MLESFVKYRTVLGGRGVSEVIVLKWLRPIRLMSRVVARPQSTLPVSSSLIFTESMRITSQDIPEGGCAGLQFRRVCIYPLDLLQLAIAISMSAIVCGEGDCVTGSVHLCREVLAQRWVRDKLN